jgi:pyruvate/2-oxoacid:ferredoxin oxidoreductase alpha subunit
MGVKSLATLIKLQKTLVDEQRTHLARLQEQVDLIDNKIAQVEIRKAREQAAAQDQESRATYGAFAKAMVAQGRALEKERQTAVAAVRIAQDKLSELFETQKRYEIAEAQRIDAATRAEMRRETLALDEIGGVMHERKRGK